MPGPPRRIGVASNFVEHTSLSHLYTSTAVFSSTSAILAASVTGYSRDHQYIKMNHFCSVRCDFEKKLWSLMDFRPLHCRHHQLTPSLTSFLGLCSITHHILSTIIHVFIALICTYSVSVTLSKTLFLQEALWCESNQRFCHSHQI